MNSTDTRPSPLEEIASVKCASLARAMCFLILFFALGSAAFAAVPSDLAEALKIFRTDPPRGWSYTQTTTESAKSRIERYDAARPDFERWTILEQDGRKPSDGEQQDYKQKLTRRSRGDTAPLITDQLALDTLETLSDSSERASYRCRLKRGESADLTADFLRVTLVVHKITRTVESFEIASVSEFSPTFAVKIAAMKTLLTFSLPADGSPSLPQKVTTHLRGRAFYFNTLDADMTLTYSDYVQIGKK